MDWAALARSGATLAVIMGVKNAPAIASTLIGASLSLHSCAIIQEGTLSTERAYRCTLGTLAQTMAEHEISAPAVYVIGEVAGL